MSDHDLAEITRSASEARRIVLHATDLKRYENPPANTPFPLEYAFHLLGDVRGKTVLDLGCGSGEATVPLAVGGAQVIGIDISPDLIELGHRRLHRHRIEADLRVGSAYETGLMEHSVDVVFCMALLHHLDIERAKQEILRVLKPNGVFIVKEPIRFTAIARWVRPLFPAKIDISEYEYPLNTDQFESLLQGFTVEGLRMFRTPLVPLLTKMIRSARLRRRVWELDTRLLHLVPALDHFATTFVAALHR
jgi:SAM-dependent methyltransferase